ncbi:MULTISPECIES: substrate-binding domain-containing protein [unclassified Frankia]|uniref:substrate-binding domain-containing protein n=1 Tax=unclassified Frankia TaxID=2632575 RepID=UPI002AD310EE|nr:MULTISPECIES: substrate-binding domain-containing protein [unclassified Frankia]
MEYQLAIDVGSAWVTAALADGGRVRVVSFGGAGSRLPAVLYLGADGSTLFGHAARRRALADPARAASDLPRRLGDPTPLLIGGASLPVASLLARLLSHVVAEVVSQTGGPPTSITVSHPASWSPYKIDLLSGALHQISVDGSPTFATCPAPVAAATYRQHLSARTGDPVAVYDLGAGSFDTAVVGLDAGSEEGSGDGPDGGRWVLRGHPDGLEHMGGRDLDEAVLGHVMNVLGDRVAGFPWTAPPEITTIPRTVPPIDPALLSGFARLRAECTEARETLSDDTEAEIGVVLPSVVTTVRITREEFDALARPALTETVAALRRTLLSVPVDPSYLGAVLLCGGLVHTPLVHDLLVAELGADVMLDVRPAGEIALGTALIAAHEASPELASPDAVDHVEGPVKGPAGDDGPAADEERTGIPATGLIPPPLPASVPPADRYRSRPGAAATAQNQVSAHEPVAPAGHGSRRLTGPVRRHPWAFTAMIIWMIPLIVIAVVLFGGGSSGGGAGEYHYASPWVYRAQEQAENLPPPAVGDVPNPGPNDVTVGGSIEVAPVTETAYALFRRQQRDVQVTTRAVNTDDGFAKLCQGQLDISGASFPKEPTAACGQDQVSAFEVAHETLPVVVDRSNTWARCLTLAQLHAVWGKESTISSWRQVDPSFPDVPLTPAGFNPGSIPNAFFNAGVNNGREEGRTDFRSYSDGNAIAQAVGSTRGAVGYVDFPTLAANTDRVSGVQINNGSGCVEPTLENARAGRYLPLCKPLYIYVRSAALRRPAVAAFVRFYLSNQAEIAVAAHTVPRDEAEIKESVEKVDELTKDVGPVRPG